MAIGRNLVNLDEYAVELARGTDALYVLWEALCNGESERTTYSEALFFILESMQDLSQKTREAVDAEFADRAAEKEVHA